MRTFVPIQAPVLQTESPNDRYRYREYLPSGDLMAYVACYWTVEFDAAGPEKLHRILPDGCVDIIFDRRASAFSEGAFVTGLMTEYAALRLNRHYSMLGIRFFAEGVRRFIGLPASEAGGRVMLEDLWGSEASRLAEEVLSAPHAAAGIEKVELKLRELLARGEDRTDPLVASGMRHLYAWRGRMSVQDLAERLSYSERNIRRAFRRELGVGPKELSAIVRFQSLLAELHAKPLSRLADTAQRYGYFDQSHLAKTFRRYYGLTPHEVFSRSAETTKS